MFGGGGTGKAEAPVELKAPSGTTPDAICRKVVYWVQRRRMLFDEARETLGDLMFSKTTDEVEQVCNATADGDLPKKTFLEALLENNAKLALNLTDRIVQNVYFGEVHDPKKSQKKAVEYARLLSTHDVLAVLLGFFEGLNFETRKAVEKLFSALIKQNYGDFITEYFLNNVERILDPILRGGFREHAVFSTVSAHMVFCASMLRSCLDVDKNPKLQPATVQPIYAHIVTSANLECMIALSNTGSNFEIASDAMATLKQIMLCDYFGKFFRPVNKPLSACTDDEKHRRLRYLRFLRSYQQPIVDLTDYSIIVPMLNGLSEMLLKRSNHAIMMKYISSKHNLKTILEALRRKSSKVRSEAFHILKIFVVNPRQPYVIRRLLAANAQNIENTLVREFEHFQSDETLTAELNAVLSVLRALPDKHAQSEDREPAYYTIIQADEECDIGVHDAPAFRRIRTEKLLAAFHAVWGEQPNAATAATLADGEGEQKVSDSGSTSAAPNQSTAAAEYEAGRDELKAALERIYPNLTPERFEEILAMPVTRQATCTHPAVALKVFDIVYLYTAFADKAEAQTYLEDMGLEGRTGVMPMPEIPAETQPDSVTADTGSKQQAASEPEPVPSTQTEGTAEQ